MHPITALKKAFPFRFSAVMMYFNNKTGGFKDKHAYRLVIITDIALLGQKQNLFSKQTF